MLAPVCRAQRQKLAAMFSACEYAGVGDVPLFALRDFQEVTIKADLSQWNLPRLRMQKPTEQWRAADMSSARVPERDGSAQARRSA